MLFDGFRSFYDATNKRVTSGQSFSPLLVMLAVKVSQWPNRTDRTKSSWKKQCGKTKSFWDTLAHLPRCGLPTLGPQSVAIVELKPDAANFGAILQEFELPNLAISAPPLLQPQRAVVFDLFGSQNSVALW